MKIATSVLYVNFSPYENAGNILDFLKKNFSTVVLFSFQFHKLHDSKHTDVCVVYQNGIEIERINLFRPPIATSLTFFLLPVRSCIIISQIFIQTLRLRSRYGPYDIFFTVNAFTAWTGNLLKKMGITEKTLFWVWDYYPPIHTDMVASVMRRIYWQFDKLASRTSTKTVFLNKRLVTLRKEMGIIPSKSVYEIIPIGTNPLKLSIKKKDKTLRLAFFGVVKKSQGLQLFFSSVETLLTTYRDIELHVIGGGPDKKYFEDLSKKYPIQAKFYGYVTDETYMKKIIGSCDIGLAPYVPEKSNVSYYSDPSKIKAYISLGVPVITTNVFTFSHEITKTMAGKIVRYSKPNEFIAAVGTIMKDLTSYQNAAYTLSKKYRYNTLYKQLFAGLD